MLLINVLHTDFSCPQILLNSLRNGCTIFDITFLTTVVAFSIANATRLIPNPKNRTIKALQKFGNFRAVIRGFRDLTIHCSKGPRYLSSHRFTKPHSHIRMILKNSCITTAQHRKTYEHTVSRLCYCTVHFQAGHRRAES